MRQILEKAPAHGSVVRTKLWPWACVAPCSQPCHCRCLTSSKKGMVQVLRDPALQAIEGEAFSSVKVVKPNAKIGSVATVLWRDNAWRWWCNCWHRFLYLLFGIKMRADKGKMVFTDRAQALFMVGERKMHGRERERKYEEEEEEGSVLFFSPCLQSLSDHASFLCLQ